MPVARVNWQAQSDFRLSLAVVICECVTVEVAIFSSGWSSYVGPPTQLTHMTSIGEFALDGVSGDGC
jgi:hypothetical protein